MFIVKVSSLQRFSIRICFLTADVGIKGESGKRRREWPLTGKLLTSRTLRGVSTTQPFFFSFLGWIGPAAPCGLRPLPRSDENIGFRSDALESKIVEELVIKK